MEINAELLRAATVTAQKLSQHMPRADFERCFPELAEALSHAKARPTTDYGDTRMGFTADL